MWYKNVGTSFFCFVTIHPFDRQTDGQTERLWQYRALHYTQSHGKKLSRELVFCINDFYLGFLQLAP